MNKFKDDRFLARWLNDELDNEELEAFKASPDYELYQKIVKGGQNIVAPEMDQQALLDRIKAGRGASASQGKPKQIWWYAAAASIVVMLGLVFYVFIGDEPDLVTYASIIGEKKELTLPDGSEVVLNANSTLSYNPESWNDKRVLKLSGEAFFSVTKGNAFSVESATGTVTVLGTQFTVQELDGLYQVKCFEGSVKVVSEAEEVVLKPQKMIRKIMGRRMEQQAFVSVRPEWLNNKSTFTSIPLKYVIKAVANQYDVRFEGDTAIDQLFTGSFPHDDLDLTLKIVLESINYTREGNVVTLSK